MQLDDPLLSLSHALAHAQYVGFGDIEYEDRDWDHYHATREDHRVKRTRRPCVGDIEVVAMFPQTWGSTALGFGGIGGQAITPAYTTILRCRGEFAVYFAGRFAYKVPAGNAKFGEDMRAQAMAAMKDQGRYKA